MEWSEDQKRALDEIYDWFEGPEQILTFGGYAGTGKSTLIKEIVEQIDGVAVAAFTGKAVNVLQRKGLCDAITLHRLMYHVDGEDEKGEPIFSRRASLQTRPSLVIVDEASMINERLHRDLEALASKILYVGDHGQLQPVGYDPGLMRDPTIKLEKIHRQAADSKILQYAYALRQGRDPLEWDEPESDDLHVRRQRPENLGDYDAVIVPYNDTRHYLNFLIRTARGYTSRTPEPGETLICLSNNYDYNIFNGMQVVVESCERRNDEIAILRYEDDGGWSRRIPIYLPQLGVSTPFQRENEIRENFGLFDWGYALTCHKVQGSEFDKVLVIESNISHWDVARWRYTAATRAAKKLTYVVEN